MNSNKRQTKEPLNVQVFDVEKCFDALWLHEVITCLFNAGIQNDKLPLLFQENKNAQVAVKTPGGLKSKHPANHHAGLRVGQFMLRCSHGQAG